MNALTWLLTGVLALGAMSGTAFMVIYTKRTAWWKEEHRAHLGCFTLALTLIMWVYLFRPLLDPTTFAVVRAPLFLAVVACMVWRLTLLLRSKRSDKIRTDREDVEREAR
jgi:hypothetical protein